jgi:phytoene/squalene synthetase
MTMPIEKRRIVVYLPAKILKDVEWLAPLEDMTCDELILSAIKRFLKPHLDIRKQVLRAAANPGRLSAPFDTAEEFIASLHKEAKKLRDKKKYHITKAISESTKDLKTGRYEV